MRSSHRNEYLIDLALIFAVSHVINRANVTDHGMVHSIYFRDPNGYVVALTAKTAAHDDLMNPATNGAREILDIWQAAKG